VTLIVTMSPDFATRRHPQHRTTRTRTSANSCEIGTATSPISQNFAAQMIGRAIF
jgi:hypothetical protein